MMNKAKYLKFLYAALPVIVVALHYGPWQVFQDHQEASDDLLRAEGYAGEDWEKAADAFAAARNKVRDLEAELALGLSEALARRNSGELIGAQEDLEALLTRAEENELEDTKLQETLRHELATTHYFMAWIMRLEGAAADEWKPDSELARQHFRLLAERERSASGNELQPYQENLEAAIRLQRMDLRDLMAWPLPKNCNCNCESLSQRKRKQRKSRNKSKGKKKKKPEKKDIRKQIKSAGKNERKGSGS